MGTEVIVHQILQSSWITDWSHSLPLSAYASQGCHVLWIRDRHGLVPHLAHPSVLRPVHRCAVFQPHHHHHHHHHAQRSASPPVYHPAQPPVAHRRSIKLYNEERRLDETILWKYDGRTNLLAQRTHNNTTTLLLLGVTSLS